MVHHYLHYPEMESKGSENPAVCTARNWLGSGHLIWQCLWWVLLSSQCTEGDTGLTDSSGMAFILADTIVEKRLLLAAHSLLWYWRCVKKYTEQYRCTRSLVVCCASSHTTLTPPSEVSLAFSPKWGKREVQELAQGHLTVSSTAGTRSSSADNRA